MRVKCFQEVKIFHVYISQRLTYSVKSYELEYEERKLEINYNFELTSHPFTAEMDNFSGLEGADMLT